MRLRTFESFWLLKNGLLYTYPMLKQHMETEIVVVGGGITGALVSYALMQEGYNTMLVDKRDIATGSTSATTSMLQYEIDVPLYQLSKKIGKEGAVACYRAGIEAIDKLQHIIEKENIDCGFKRTKSLYVAHNKKAVKWLQQECQERSDAELGVTWMDEKEILDNFGIQCHGGILSDTSASVDAYQLAHELIALNVKRGMEVYDQTNIEKINYHDNGATLITEEGFEIKARKVIFCTGYESTYLLKEKIAKLIFTWASVSEEDIAINSNLNNTLVWNTDDPYVYMRTTDDGRLLVGGEDSNYKPSYNETSIKKRKSKKLQKQLTDLLPGVQYIEDFNWGGIFGISKDGLPYIGESPEHRHAIFVLGFGGNGITFSIQGMDIVCDLLKGKEHPLAHYYRFGR